MTYFASQKALVVDPMLEGGQALRGHHRREGLMTLVVVNIPFFTSFFLSIYPSLSAYHRLPGDTRGGARTECAPDSPPFV